MSIKLNNLFLAIINPGTLILFLLIIVSFYILVMYIKDNSVNYNKTFLNIFFLLCIWIAVILADLINTCHHNYLELSKKNTYSDMDKISNELILNQTTNHIFGLNCDNAMIKLVTLYYKMIIKFCIIDI